MATHSQLVPQSDSPRIRFRIRLWVWFFAVLCGSLRIQWKGGKSPTTDRDPWFPSTNNCVAVGESNPCCQIENKVTARREMKTRIRIRIRGNDFCCDFLLLQQHPRLLRGKWMLYYFRRSILMDFVYLEVTSRAM